jgi:hypothetical protein
LCFPQILPFAIVLIATSGILFISFGVVALFIKSGLL